MIETRLETPVLGYDHIPDLTYLLLVIFMRIMKSNSRKHMVTALRCLLRRLRDQATILVRHSIKQL